MKLRNTVKFIVLSFLLAATGASAEDYEWTKSAISKVDKKGDKGSYVLGNGAVHFFPEVVAGEVGMGRMAAEFTVYDRFRVIFTLTSRLELSSKEFLATQKVPTSELLPILHQVISSEVDTDAIKKELAELSATFADFAQYRIDD